MSCPFRRLAQQTFKSLSFYIPLQTYRQCPSEKVSQYSYALCPIFQSLSHLSASVLSISQPVSPVSQSLSNLSLGICPTYLSVSVPPVSRHLSHLSFGLCLTCLSVSVLTIFRSLSHLSLGPYSTCLSVCPIYLSAPLPSISQLLSYLPPPLSKVKIYFVVKLKWMKNE